MSKNNKKRIVLLDSHAILHRAYHALPEFTSTKGEPTGALYGLCLMLLKIINELKPNYIIACFDFPSPTHRHESYEGYKANRPKTDTELVGQIIRAHDVFKAFNIPIYEVEGFEADDLLGTIAEKLKYEKDTETIIASGDMDTLQLVDGDDVLVYTLKKGIKDTIIYNEKRVFERFGFGPKLLPDYKGLRGDPSDNIIGIKGIGDKTASILIQKFGTIENIYKELKKDESKFEKAGITKRIINLLKEGKEEAIFSKILATIRLDSLRKFDLPEKEMVDNIDLEKIKKELDELGFRSIWQKVSDMFSKKGISQETVNKKNNNDEMGQITEVKNNKEKEAPKDTQNISEIEIKKIGIALWLTNSNITNPDFDKILNFSHATSFEEAKKIILDKVKKDGLTKLYEEIELPFLPITEEMKERGIKIDTEFLKNLSKKLHIDLDKIKKEIWKKAGAEFNINSPKQLGEILFEKMQIKVKGLRKTPAGAYSTKESELLKMQGTNEIVDDILKYRELQKLLSTYIDNIPDMVGDDGRLHANFIQTGTTTGRLSSNDPNLQNIPTKTELGNEIRKAFVVEKGFKLLSFDYSQIELRIVAILSGDKNLIQIFKEGGDIHSAVASKVFNVLPKDVTSEMRRKAKVINFGILYGMGVNSLKKNLGTSREEAEIYLSNYFETFSGVAEYLENIKKEVFKKGFTETLFGRRRYFEEIKSRFPHIRASVERMAINAPIQGTSADVIKIATVKIEEFLKKEKIENDCSLLLQIHDELVYEVKENVVNRVCLEIKKIMESVLTEKESLGIKLVADASVGDNWGEMQKIT
ncbi:MAG: DNA polymerase I [Parcubacteria group bacterium Athens0714_16]|nr:MAG: DNA polymerase I [Parcubacteria group bacterium Athens0714_16]